MVNNPKIIIDDEAKKALKDAYMYIKKDSLKNAEKVRIGILKSIEDLIKNPFRYPFDKYRQDKDISYRAYEIFKYRITYHVAESEIRIIRIRHSKMNPLEY
ncbi:MAG TPA: type II toxin-antitoxin system RelE/ParE family toxin [Hanamia sp.]